MFFVVFYVFVRLMYGASWRFCFGLEGSISVERRAFGLDGTKVFQLEGRKRIKPSPERARFRSSRATSKNFCLSHFLLVRLCAIIAHWRKRQRAWRPTARQKTTSFAPKKNFRQAMFT